MKKLLLFFLTLVSSLAYAQSVDVIPSCLDNTNYSVGITFNGTAGETYTISDNLGTDFQSFTTSVGNLSYGQYPNNIPVTISITQDSNNATFTSNSINQDCSNYAQCPSSITLSSQSAIDNFVVIHGCTEINGSLTISGDDITNLNGLSSITTINGGLTIQSTDLTNLEGLNNLQFIGGRAIIGSNTNLVNFDGLDALQYVGARFDIYSNANLSSLSGMETLKSVGASTNYYQYGFFAISNNSSLISLDGLQSLEYIQNYFRIYNNDLLTDVSALTNLETVNSYIEFDNNDALVNLNAFNALTNITSSLSIFDNSELSQINGFSNLSTISGSVSINRNDKLIKMNGLSNIQTIGSSLSITQNDLLTQLDDFSNLTSVNSITIEDNATLTDISGISQFTNITGNLYINNNPELSDLNDLSGLEEVNGTLQISGNNQLNNLNGLSSLSEVSSLNISNNPALINFLGLTNLDTISNTLTIHNNDALQNFSGMNSLEYIGGSLSVENNDAITNFEGLSSLSSIGFGNTSSSSGVSYFQIYNNDSLQNLDGLEALTQIRNYLNIRENNNLLNIDGLIGLTTVQSRYINIYDNDSLLNINGLSSITTLGSDINISYNDSLIDISGISQLTNLPGNLTILENASLENLNGISLLETISGSITVENNNALENIDALNNLITVGGNITIENNDLITEINGLSSITTISGSIFIQGNINLTDISGLSQFTTFSNNIYIEGNTVLPNLNAFSGLTEVGGTFEIDNNSTLTDLSGLENLETINNLNIHNNSALENLQGLAVLDTIQGSLSISGNSSLQNINIEGLIFIGNSLGIANNDLLVNTEGLTDLQYINGSLRIFNNQSLETIDGFQGIDTIGYELQISDNPVLTSLIGFENLAVIGGLANDSYYSNSYNSNAELIINDNDALTDLSGFESLIFVEDNLNVTYNDALESLNGLDSLQTIDGYIQLQYNSNLSSIDALANLETVNSNVTIRYNDVLSECCIVKCWGAGVVNGTTYVSNNDENCNSIDEIQTSCPLGYCSSLNNPGVCGYYALGGGPFDDFYTPACTGLTLSPDREIYANEAYRIYAQAGTYKFSFCDGYNSNNPDWGGDAIIKIGRDNNSDGEIDDLSNLIADTIGCEVEFIVPNNNTRLLIVVNDANCNTVDYIQSPNGSVSLETIVGAECLDCTIDDFNAGEILPSENQSICLGGNYSNIEFISDGSEYQGLNYSSSSQEGYGVSIDLSALNNFYGVSNFGNYFAPFEDLNGSLQDVQDALDSQGYTLVPGTYTINGGVAFTGFVGGILNEDNTICIAENQDNSFTIQILDSTNEECEATAGCLNGFLDAVNIVIPIANNNVTGNSPFIAFTNCTDETAYVEFYVDGELVGTDPTSDGSGFYEVSFNSFQYDEGVINLEVIAYDYGGATYTDSQNAIVNNFGPSFTISTTNDDNFFDYGNTYNIEVNYDIDDEPSYIIFQIEDEDGITVELNTDINPPFTTSFNVDEYDLGEVITIVAIGFDDFGQQTIEEFSATVSQSTSIQPTGQIGYINSYVEPNVGTPEDTYTFVFDYFANPGVLPQNGYPLLQLDYAPDGDYLDPEDYEVIMTKENPSDSDPSDGIRYIYTFNGLSIPPSGTWSGKISCIDTNGETIQQNLYEPKVTLDLLDVAIYADDIEISNYQPELGEEIEISITVSNTSDFLAENIDVHLYTEEEITGNLIAAGQIPIIYPQSSETISFTWTTPDEDAFIPLKAIIDFNNLLDEKNELNNAAIRPIVNGDYVVAGTIAVSNISTTPSTVFTGANISLTGKSNYEDIIAQAENSNINLSVSGATVNFTIIETGQNISGHTNNEGCFYIPFDAPLSEGTYTIEGTITDYTIIGNFGPVSFNVVPRPASPDLRSSIYFNNCVLTEGISQSGIAYFKNWGNENSGITSAQIRDCNGIVVTTLNVPDLSPNQTVELPFSYTFSESGYCTLFLTADVFDESIELNENNNTATTTQFVEPPMPDLVPSASGAGNIYVGQERTHTVSISNLGGIPTSTSFNVNYSIEDENDNVVFNNSISIFDLLETCGDKSTFEFSYTYNTVGVFEVKIQADTPIGSGSINEFYEDNNEISFNVVVNTPPPPKPNLGFSDCTLEVNPNPPTSGDESLLVSATLYNSGNLDYNSSIPILVEILDGDDNPVYSTTISQSGLQAGESTNLEFGLPLQGFGDYYLLLTVDPNDTVDEKSESDNDTGYPLCWDFQFSNSCYYYYNYFRPFFDYSHYIETPVKFNVGFRNIGLFDAPEISATFKIYDENGNFVTELTDVEGGAPSDLCRSNCPLVIGYGASYTFYNPGIYTVEIELDSNNLYNECNEDNNILVVPLNIIEKKPDLRILSEYINPTELNPDPNEEVDVIITIENIGQATADPFDLECLVDDILVGTVNIPAIPPGEEESNVCSAWSSGVNGAHIMRAIADPTDIIDEEREDNNEASRLIIVGESTNLEFTQFDFSNDLPQIGEEITVTVTIANNGSLDATGQLNLFTSTVNNPAELAYPETWDLNLIAGASITETITWVVEEKNTTFTWKISNVEPEEFNTLDNTTSKTLSTFTIEIVSKTPLTCDQATDGTVLVNIDGGIAPFTYEVIGTGETGTSDTNEFTVYNLGYGEFNLIVTDSENNPAFKSDSFELPDFDCGNSVEIIGIIQDVRVNDESGENRDKLESNVLTDTNVYIHYANAPESNPLASVSSDSNGEFTFSNSLFENLEYIIKIEVNGKKFVYPTINDIEEEYIVPATLMQQTQESYQYIKEFNPIESYNNLNELAELLSELFDTSYFLEVNQNNFFESILNTPFEIEGQEAVKYMIILYTSHILFKEHFENAEKFSSKMSSIGVNFMTSMFDIIKSDKLYKKAALQDYISTDNNPVTSTSTLIRYEKLGGLDDALLDATFQGVVWLLEKAEPGSENLMASKVSTAFTIAKDNFNGNYTGTIGETLKPLVSTGILKYDYINNTQTDFDEIQESLQMNEIPIENIEEINTIMNKVVGLGATNDNLSNTSCSDIDLLSVQDEMSDCEYIDKLSECKIDLVDDLVVVADGVDFVGNALLFASKVTVGTTVGAGAAPVLAGIAAALKFLSTGLQVGAIYESWQGYNNVKENQDIGVYQHIIQNPTIDSEGKLSFTPCPVEYFTSKVSELELVKDNYNSKLEELLSNIQNFNGDSIILQTINELSALDTLYDSSLIETEAIYGSIYLSNQSNQEFLNDYRSLFLENYSKGIMLRKSLAFYGMACYIEPNDLSYKDSLYVTYEQVLDTNNELIEGINIVLDNYTDGNCSAYIEVKTISDFIKVSPNNQFTINTLIKNDSPINAEGVSVILQLQENYIQNDTVYLGTINSGDYLNLDFNINGFANDTIIQYDLFLLSDNAFAKNDGGLILVEGELNCELFNTNSSSFIVSNNIFEIGDTLYANSFFTNQNINHNWYINNQLISNEDSIIIIPDTNELVNLSLETVTEQGCTDFAEIILYPLGEIDSCEDINVQTTLFCSENEDLSYNIIFAIDTPEDVYLINNSSTDTIDTEGNLTPTINMPYGVDYSFSIISTVDSTCYDIISGQGLRCQKECPLSENPIITVDNEVLCSPSTGFINEAILTVETDMPSEDYDKFIWIKGNELIGEGMSINVNEPGYYRGYWTNGLNINPCESLKSNLIHITQEDCTICLEEADATFNTECNEGGTFNVIVEITSSGVIQQADSIIANSSLVIIDNIGTVPSIVSNTLGSQLVFGNYISGSEIIVEVLGPHSNCLNTIISEILTEECVSEPSECTLQATPTVQCNEDNGTYQVVTTVIGGTGNYAFAFGVNTAYEALTGNTEAGFASGSYTDGEAYYISVIDNDTACEVVLSNTVECTKTAIELLSFNGRTNENNNQLFWTTASETNNDYFEIMRSRDGVNFESVGKVNSVGDSNTPTSYEFVDIDISAKTTYYRLEAIDTDGKATSSNIIELNRELMGQISVVPNPASDFINVSVTVTPNTDLNVKLFDVQGKLVLAKTLTNLSANSFNLDVSTFSKGLYFLQIESNGTAQQATFIVD